MLLVVWEQLTLIVVVVTVVRVELAAVELSD
jgi:hypothetical protein